MLNLPTSVGKEDVGQCTQENGVPVGMQFTIIYYYQRGHISISSRLMNSSSSVLTRLWIMIWRTFKYSDLDRDSTQQQQQICLTLSCSCFLQAELLLPISSFKKIWSVTKMDFSIWTSLPSQGHQSPSLKRTCYHSNPTQSCLPWSVHCILDTTVALQGWLWLSYTKLFRCPSH